MNYNWNWGIFFQTSPDGVHTYLETLLLGTGWTLATALSAWCLALAMGSLVGVIRTTPNPWLVRLGTAYVELFRNIPLLVQMFLWYFVLPELLPTQLGDWLKQLPAPRIGDVFFPMPRPHLARRFLTQSPRRRGRAAGLDHHRAPRPI